MTLWRAPEPLVLASKSRARQSVLMSAGIPLDVVVADIDERAIEARAGHADPQTVATMLACEKARAVAGRVPGRIVVGADQTLALGTQRFSKPAGRESACEQLRALRGKTHVLCSGVAVARGKDILFEHCSVARLTMREFSDAFLESYLDVAGTDVTASVGGYQLEKTGIQLFSRIDGDHFTILGMPLMPLLVFFRQEGFLVT